MAPIQRKTLFFQTCLGVFQGGGCRAAAFVGAFEEAVAHGVHFAEIAGTSAGSIAAALIGAGASPDRLKESISQLNFKRFLVEPDNPDNKLASADKPAWLSLLKFTRFAPYRYFFTHLGIHSSIEIEKWVENELEALLPNAPKPIVFKDLPIPTWVIATDLRTRGVRIWSSKQTPEAEVAPAVRASCSIPVFFQPVDSRLVDGGTLSNLPSFVFMSSDPTQRPLSSRILAFTLEANDEELDTSSAFGLVTAMLNTVVDGSRDLQLKIQSEVHVVSIPTDDIKATDFDKITPDNINILMDKGKKATRQFFLDELARVKSKPPIGTLCNDRDEIYSAIVENLEHTVQDILIADTRTDWAYSLYPSLLHWRVNGVPIRVLLDKNYSSAHEAYRRRLLGALGVEVFEVSPPPPVRAYLFDSKDIDRARAVVGIPTSSEDTAIRYSGRHDFAAIDSIRSRIEASCIPAAKVAHYTSTSTPSLVKCDENEIRKALSSVAQYDTSDVDISVRNVSLDSLISLTLQVREYKYRQIRRLMGLYQQFGIIHFQPVKVNYGEGRYTIITPPVVEESGDNYVLIEGTTRSVFCRDNGPAEIRCVVVSGVQVPLPTEQRVDLKHVRITGRAVSLTKRYGVSNLDIRRIEECVHPVSIFS